MRATPDAAAREMATAYDPSAVEQQLYAWWEGQGFFRPSGEGEPFTIVMPPPNLTGELHVGSAMFVTVEDILIRWHRMLGHDTLWQPGVDHAAIAVNAIVEGLIAKEGLSRHDLGREQFLERVWEFVGRSRHYISQQFRRLGASADWEREVFTMDEGPQLAVRTTFKNLYDDGLIYRGEYLINWCPACETAISDLEVEHEDEDGSFWHVRYPIVDEQGEPTDQQIVIATTRPETIPADTAIAVHPEDDRYRGLIGRHVQVPTTGRTVPVIADEAVSIEGGSGVLKVTPGHDPVDFEIGQRHDLPILSIIATDGTMNDEAGAYTGLDRFVAREKIVEDIAEQGLLERIEPYTHPVGHCQRSGDIVEPLVSEQWFVRMEPLAKRGIEAVEQGDLHFVPQRFERTYMQWLENIRDWCISRQIWWGHRIPAWYCEDCEEVTVATDDPTECASCGSAKLRQDEDTLDTWFSSGLWPHSTLGWPKETPEFDRYYSTQVMETGYDIIFFWVARMVMLSLYNTDKVPFETVYLHGMVRAADGQKMSKSKGNVTDPIEAIDEFGTDALRYTLVAGSSPGNDQRISDQRLDASRNFANKLWNASRFVLSSVEDGDDLAAPTAEGLTTVEDRWILSRTERLVADYDDLMGRFELAAAAGRVRDFFWDEYADWYIELAKVRLRAGDRTPIPVLLHVVDRVLRLLHPVMPYVTEEIWQRLTAVRPDPDDAPALIVAPFPRADASFEDAEAERELDAVQDFVRAIRNIRAEKNVDAGHWAEAYIVGDSAAESARATADAIEAMARARPLHIVDSADDAPSDGAVTSVLPVGRVVLPMAGLFDADAERERLGKQIEEAKADVERIGKKLGNRQFVSRAPDNVVQTERDRLATAEGRLAGLEQSLTEIG
ncbi:MAG TPA: valine--tRNA ligase [Dehalococcoidia bacterium]|nr:valine--tRNA ligase [Dehalococcoidia bacterium]